MKGHTDANLPAARKVLREHPRLAAVCASLLLVAAAAASSAAVPARPPARAPFLIRADSASCLLRNSARYSEVKDYPFYLFVDLCPQVRPAAEAISKLNSNVYIKERKPADGTPLRAILRVNEREMTCLLNQIRKKQGRGTQYLLINLANC